MKRDTASVQQNCVPAYLAHIDDDGHKELVIEHLEAVATMAGEFAAAFGCREQGEQLGMAHDIGKYSQAFQKRIRGTRRRVDHSTAGAYELLKQGAWWGAYCVAGHHGGLPDGGTVNDTGALAARIQKAEDGKLEDYSAFADEVALPKADQPSLNVSHCKTQEDFLFSNAFAVRMLFSCLVDSDFLCTEEFMQGQQRERLAYEPVDQLAEKLEAYIEQICRQARSSQLNDIRQRVSSECLAAAQQQPGVFTLTVPTGGGKTLASMRFALNHALQHGMRRVIYAIPYTSIIEQNAQVFRDVFGVENVLEHHSNFDFADAGDGIGERLRLAAENWDAPIVVTTNVQLFESLFASRTSRCRKLHNIVGSVIVLDEAQMIPVPCIDPCVHALAELVVNYGCSVVLCTATQPALNGRFEALNLQVGEIMSDTHGLAEKLERVTYEDAGKLGNEQLAQQLAAQPQVLCVLNSRQQVRDVCALLHAAGAEGIFQLSTLMHSVHRSQVINEIRECLAAGQPCRVVSTSLVEAGVDLDFPVVYRSLAGVDSITQAAGRCNREGTLGRAGGRVVVFRPEDGVRVPAETEFRSGLTEEALRAANSDFTSVGSLESVEWYFKVLMQVEGDRLDKAGILKQLGTYATCARERAVSIPFRSVAESFRLIEEGSAPVIIPDKAVCREVEALQAGFATRADMRRLSRYSVSVYQEALCGLVDCGAAVEVGDQLYLLCDEALYDEATGLGADAGGRGLQW